jgi:hypothetical protein
MADLRISEFIESTSSDRISPGAVAAGAVALALGAAWAEKAVSISLKPSPHDPSLAMALVGLEKVHSFALQWRRGFHVAHNPDITRTWAEGYRGD